MKKISLAPLLMAVCLITGCASDDDYTPPALSQDLALSRIESAGNKVFAGGHNQVLVYQVSATGQLNQVNKVPVSGQVQDLLVADGHLFAALPEKTAGYTLQNPQTPQWQYQVQAKPLISRTAYAGGLLGLLHITDTMAILSPYHQFYMQGILHAFNHTGAQPLAEVVTPFRASVALAATANCFLVGEEEQLLVYPTDSLASGNYSQEVPARLLGLQAAPSGLVAVASDAPRVLSFYQLQQGQLQLLSQVPLAP